MLGYDFSEDDPDYDEKCQDAIWEELGRISHYVQNEYASGKNKDAIRKSVYRSNHVKRFRDALLVDEFVIWNCVNRAFRIVEGNQRKAM